MKKKKEGKKERKKKKKKGKKNKLKKEKTLLFDDMICVNNVMSIYDVCISMTYRLV